jgi:dihydrofolate reductase
MKISMIAALDENRLIGSGAGIPWHLPRDSQHFRDYTAGKAMLLGRRTVEEMTGWFATQRPIVLTRDAGYAPAGGEVPAGFAVAGSVESAMELAKSRGEDELVVSGGAQVYVLALPFAKELLITEVHASFAGRAYFPEILPVEWHEVARERFEVDVGNPHAMSFVRYRRRS